MFRSKKSMMIVSIAVSLFLWSFVVIVNNPVETTTIKAVPVTLLNIESLTQKGLVMTSDDDFTVDVKIEGKKSEINKIKKDDIIAEADLYGYGAGEHIILVSLTVPGNVSYAGAGNLKIKVNIEEMVSKYENVEVEVTGTLKDGTEIGAIKTQPEEISVKGAKSVVEKVDRVVVRIPAYEVTKNETALTLAAQAVDKEGKNVKNVTLSAKTVQVSARLYQTKEVPLTVPVTGNVNSSYTLSKISVPDTVVIKGTKEAVDGITSLTARSVNIEGITASTKLPVYIALPNGVELAHASEDIHVLVEIKGKGSSSLKFTSGDISVLNVTQGFSAYVNTSEITMTVAGRTSLINSLSKDKFTLSVDAAGLAAGTYLLPLNVQYDEKYDSVQVYPTEVYVTVSE